jgi:hypothetical protein
VIGTDWQGKWRAASSCSDPKLKAPQTGPAACHDDRTDLPDCSHHKTGNERNALVEARCVDPPKRKRRGGVGREQAQRGIAQPIELPPEAALGSGVNGKCRGRIPAAQSFCNDVGSWTADILRSEKRHESRIGWVDRALVRDREIGMTPLQQCGQSGRARAAQADNANHWTRSLFNPIQTRSFIGEFTRNDEVGKSDQHGGKDCTPSLHCASSLPNCLPIPYCCAMQGAQG